MAPSAQPARSVHPTAAERGLSGTRQRRRPLPISVRLLFLTVFLCAMVGESAAITHETTGPFGIAVRISTLAGRKGSAGFKDGMGTAALFNAPEGCLVSSDGEKIFVADTGNNLIREIRVATGQVSVLAGSASGGGFSDGPASSAQLAAPRDLALGSSGILYVADYGNCAVREYSAQSATVTTVAGGTCIATESNGICRAGSVRVTVFLSVSEQTDGGYAGDVHVSFAYPGADGSTQTLPWSLLVERSQAGQSYSAQFEVPAVPTQLSIRAKWALGTNWHDNLGIKGLYLNLCGSRTPIPVLEDPAPGGTASADCDEGCPYWLDNNEHLEQSIGGLASQVRAARLVNQPRWVQSFRW